MTSELNTLHARLERLEQDNARIQSQFHAAQRRLRIQAGLAFGALVAAIFLSPGSRAVIAQGYGLTLAGLDARLKTVEAKTQYMSVNTTAKSTTFSGCNVVVNDGGGTTDTIVQNAAGEGLGNLIIGYNQSRGRGQDARAGCHNLIVGDFNNYLYIGGIVAGYNNTISNSYTAVLGGFYNTASGLFTSVAGGYLNSAGGYATTIVGGRENASDGYLTSILGGSSNTTSGSYASISGGSSNTASGDSASVTGGYFNTASGSLASVAGGYGGTASGKYSSVSGGGQPLGGFGVTQSHEAGWAAGGAGAGTYHSP